MNLVGKTIETTEYLDTVVEQAIVGGYAFLLAKFREKPKPDFAKELEAGWSVLRMKCVPGLGGRKILDTAQVELLRAHSTGKRLREQAEEFFDKLVSGELQEDRLGEDDVLSISPAKTKGRS